MPHLDVVHRAGAIKRAARSLRLTALRRAALRALAFRSAIRMAVWLSYRNRFLRRRVLRMADGMVMACAFGGRLQFLGQGRHPVTILVRAGADVDRFELFAADPVDGQPCLDRAAFARVIDAVVAPAFGAGIHRIVTDNHTVDRSYFVRVHVDGRTRDSDIIRAKIASQPTRSDPDALRSDDNAAPTFTWQPSHGGDTWMSFLLVTRAPDQPDANRSLLTAVYSRATAWTFPDVRRVPFYYHPLTPAPRLQPGDEYEVTRLAIDSDGWITDLDALEFMASDL